MEACGSTVCVVCIPGRGENHASRSEENGRLKLVVTMVECLLTKHYLASYSHANFRQKLLPSCELFKKIAECGVNQHFGIVSGNVTDEVKALAQIMDFDLYVI